MSAASSREPAPQRRKTPRATTILLVEDDAVERWSLTRALRRRGLADRLRVARDGEQALDILRGTNGEERLLGPHVVLLDLNLPRMDGLELLRELRADPALAAAVVFVLTTSNHDADRAAASAQGVAGYALKSSTADVDALVERVAARLGVPSEPRDTGR